MTSQRADRCASVGDLSRAGEAVAHVGDPGLACLHRATLAPLLALVHASLVAQAATWTQVSTTGPARRLHAMAYESLRDRPVLFGGDSSRLMNLDDTWEWDGSTWTQVATTGPIARSGHGMVDASHRLRTVLFGGGFPTDLSDTWEWLGGLAGTAATYGAGCGSPALVLSPVGHARPIISTTAQASLTNIPSTLAVVAVGLGNTRLGAITLPLSLAPYGMPGCELLQSANVGFPRTVSGGAATISLLVPNSAGLVGAHLYLQGWAHAPGANSADLILSNGVEWMIGNT